MCIEAFVRSVRCTAQQQTETGSDVRAVARSAGGVEGKEFNALQSSLLALVKPRITFCTAYGKLGAAVTDRSAGLSRVFVL